MRNVEHELKQLPEPVPPATLAPTVMARVSRVADARTSPSLTGAVSVRSQREQHTRRWSDLPAWASALAGLAVVVVSWIAGGLAPGWWLAPISSQTGVQDLAKIPPNAQALLGLALGLLLYVAGLFAPLRNRR